MRPECRTQWSETHEYQQLKLRPTQIVESLRTEYKWWSIVHEVCILVRIWTNSTIFNLHLPSNVLIVFLVQRYLHWAPSIATYRCSVRPQWVFRAMWWQAVEQVLSIMRNFVLPTRSELSSHLDVSRSKRTAKLWRILRITHRKSFRPIGEILLVQYERLTDFKSVQKRYLLAPNFFFPEKRLAN